MAGKTNLSSEIIPGTSTDMGVADNNIFTITGHKLNGQNYLQWSQSIMMFICGKGKDDYLTGVTSQPEEADPKFWMWKFENNMVMSWLLSSMTNEIGENFLLYDTTHDIIGSC